jgi:hypothetical protein
MQFALLIYESPEAFAARKRDGTDPYTGLRMCYKRSSRIARHFLYPKFCVEKRVFQHPRLLSTVTSQFTSLDHDSSHHAPAPLSSNLTLVS